MSRLSRPEVLWSKNFRLRVSLLVKIIIRMPFVMYECNDLNSVTELDNCIKEPDRLLFMPGFATRDIVSIYTGTVPVWDKPFLGVSFSDRK